MRVSPKKKSKMSKEGRLPNRYKETEFEIFLKMHKLDQEDDMHFIGTLTNQKIAEALGISHETITEWKKDPRFIEIKQKAVKNALKGMVKAGGDDWRMYRELAKINGIGEETTVKNEYPQGIPIVDMDKLPPDSELAKLIKGKK